MEKETRDMIRAAMASAALQHGISLESLDELIRLQYELGRKSKDAAVRALWRKIPSSADLPTPEEVVGYFTAVRLGLINL